MPQPTVERRPLIEISRSPGWRPLDLAELLQYRELLGVMVWRDIKVRYRQTVLGVLWVVVQPLLTMGIFTVLFSRVARLQPDRDIPYSLFIMAALVPWTFFSAAVSSASNSLIGSAHLISKVYFPRMIIPAAAVLAALADMAVTLVMVLGMCVWSGTGLGPSMAFLPAIIAVTAAFAFGCGLWLSSLNVEYRDVRVVVPFILQIWMYVTPVVYPRGVLPPRFRWIVELNPMTGLVEAFRSSLIGDPVPWPGFLWAASFATLVVISGAFYFRRTERQFADLL